MPPAWRGGRPPWWPEGEAWPALGRGRPPWAGGLRTRSFFLRIAVFGLFLWLISAATMGVLGGVLVRAAPGWLLVPLIVMAIALVAGIREVRRAARAFNSMRARAEANEQRRRSFLADVTHELKTPLAVIRGQAEGIADGVYPPSPDSVKPILEAAATLEVLIEDLRTLALSEAGALALNREPVDLAVMVNELLASHAQAGVELHADVPADLPPADADPVRVRGVLNNLLTNAIRHTPAGGSVTVSARRRGGEVEISVTDTGEGIPAELMPRVFDRFVRGPGSKGTGLGLAIAKDVVEAHGGVIAAESVPGPGTTIRFTLPPHPP
jgi:two-component system, OmpR family, sensor histidine kinase BaeS